MPDGVDLAQCDARDIGEGATQCAEQAPYDILVSAATGGSRAFGPFLNMEMEAATLLTMASALGLRAGVVCGIVAQRGQSDKIAPPEVFARATEAAIEVALRAAATL